MKYLSNIKISFKREMSSRITTLITFLSKPLLLVITIMLWNSIYSYTNNKLINGFTLNNTINYMIFSIIFGEITINYVDGIIADEIHSGILSTKLIKPINYCIEKLFETIGKKLYSCLFELLPGIIIALFFGFHIYDPIMALISIISLGLGIILNFFISINWSLMYFKVKNSGLLEYFKDDLFYLFSGLILPINFMPRLFQNILSFLPFQLIIYVPSRIFINTYSISQSIIFIAIQICWIILLYLIYKIGWNYALRNFEGVGL